MLTLLGPVAGAAVVVAVGATAASVANAATFVASALLVAGISYSRPTGATPPDRGLRTIGEDFVAGIRMVLSSRFVAIGAVVITIGNLAIFVIESNLFYLALRVEHLPRVAVGVVFAGQGLGSVIGAVLAPRLIDRVGVRSALWVGVAVSTVAMCLPVLLPSWPVVLVAWTIQGVSTSFVVVSYFTARQELIPAAAIGRAASVTRAVAYTALPVGALLGGWLIERTPSVQGRLRLRRGDRGGTAAGRGRGRRRSGVPAPIRRHRRPELGCFAATRAPDPALSSRRFSGLTPTAEKGRIRREVVVRSPGVGLRRRDCPEFDAAPAAR